MDEKSIDAPVLSPQGQDQQALGSADQTPLFEPTNSNKTQIVLPRVVAGSEKTGVVVVIILQAGTEKVAVTGQARSPHPWAHYLSTGQKLEISPVFSSPANIPGARFEVEQHN